MRHMCVRVDVHLVHIFTVFVALRNCFFFPHSFFFEYLISQIHRVAFSGDDTHF